MNAFSISSRRFAIWAFCSAILPLLATCLSFTCPGDGYYGDPDDCGAYYLCSSGTSTALKYKCGEGLLWERKRKLCDWADNVKCGIESSESEFPPPVVSLGDGDVDNNINTFPNNGVPSNERTDRPTKEPIEPIKNYCVTKEDGMYPNTEKACRQYYACADGEMIRLKMCDEGTVFDIQRLACERPVYVAPPCGSALFSLTDYTKNGAKTTTTTTTPSRLLASTLLPVVLIPWMLAEAR